MQEDFVPLEDVRKCLERSGYLLESRLVRSLTDLGYFVEPNQMILDVRTGKSREIDLVAEFFHYVPERPKICARTHFVVEALNNRFPFVLTTQRPYSPAANFESYVKFICTPDVNPFVEAIDIYQEKEAHWDNLFSQYCVLTRKSGDKNKELMASHTDDVYGSLLKLAEYTEGEISQWNLKELKEDEYWRWFFWQPMLVLSGQLIAVKLSEDGSPKLEETNMGRLEFNWHEGEKPKTTVIDVVTEQFFLTRTEMIVKKDDEIEGKMFMLRQEP